jgi:hypothetical protein
MEIRKTNIVEMYMLLEAEKAMGHDVKNFFIEKLNVSGKLYVPPCPMLSLFEFIEFVYVDTLFVKYIEKHAQPDLDKLCAILYRHPNENYKKNILVEKRSAFESSLLESMANVFARVPMEFKNFILFNYSHIREWLGKIYPNVFSGKEKKVRGENDTWLNIRDFLSPAVSDLEKVDKTPLHDVLRRLNNQLKEKN